MRAFEPAFGLGQPSLRIVPTDEAFGQAEADGRQRLPRSTRRLAVEDKVVHRVERLARNQVSQEAPGEYRDRNAVAGIAASEENVVRGTNSTDRRRKVERRTHVPDPTVRDRNVGERGKELSEGAREPLVVRVPFAVGVP
jgi:hypothetical protein